MKLTHYCRKKFIFDRQHQYVQKNHFKPKGFWVSVDGEHGWKEWCEAESFGLDRLKHCYVVKLKPDANILRISNSEEFIAFEKEYLGQSSLAKMYPEERWTILDQEIQWDKVAEKYDGIIISPYLWKHRLESMWFYGWDCASGCIWNLDCVDSLTEVGND